MTRWTSGMHSRLRWQIWNPNSRRNGNLKLRGDFSMLLLIIVLLLLFGGGGGYYGYSRWGPRGGLGIGGTILLIVVVLYLVGALR